MIRDIFRMSSKEYLLPRERSSTLDIRGALHFADAKGWNVSHFASSSNNIELLGLLMDIGCDVNRKAKDGVTPLHIASTKSVAMVHVLLSSGSKPKQRANGGITSVRLSSNLSLSLNTHNTQTTQIHVASQNKNIRKMLTTRLSPGGKSIRFLDRSWSRRLIESETSKSIRMFSKAGWTVLFEVFKIVEEVTVNLGSETHFKMHLRRLGRGCKRRGEDTVLYQSFRPRSADAFVNISPWF